MFVSEMLGSRDNNTYPVRCGLRTLVRASSWVVLKLTVLLSETGIIEKLALARETNFSALLNQGNLRSKIRLRIRKMRNMSSDNRCC